MTNITGEVPSFIIPVTNESQRLFHGRGHYYPGLAYVCIDWYAPVILITLYSEVGSDWLQQLSAKVQKKIPDCRSIQVQYRYRSKAPVECLWGENIQSLIVAEHQLKYHVNLANNQNHGLFLDMANGRQWVIKHSQNKRILNLFSYTCAFSVCAIAGGADYVLNLDMSKKALSQGRENHRLNKQDLSRVKYAAVNLFKSWGKLRRGSKFDLLICDPPSFQKGSIDLERDYKKIIKRIPEFMASNSDILLCYNAPHLDQQFILDTVKEHCPDCQFQQQIDNPEVYRETSKGKGLKVMYFIYHPNRVS
jgi:23S rRNA (cytosine1962-C5)-methyltransferase